MNTSSVYIHKAALSQTGNSHVLKEGSSVLVRISADKGNGSYEGFVAGVKVSIQSKIPLEQGSVFVGKVLVKDGKINIIPEQNTLLAQDKIEIKNLNVQSSQNLFAQVASAEISLQLQALGLVPDNFSLHLFLQTKQLGMKIDVPLFNKIRNIAIKYKGKEKQVANLLLNLLQKGMEVSEEELEKLLNQFDFSDLDFESETGLLQKEKNDSKNFVWEFITNILQGVTGHQNGVLTVMNHLGWQNKKSNGSWVIFPFEFLQNDIILGNGKIKLFLDTQKKLKLLATQINLEEKEYNFVLNFYKNKINSINVSVQPMKLSKINEFVNELQAKFSDDESVCVNWCKKEQIEDFAAGLENITFVDGVV